jgi:hypothetical protein
MICERAIEAKVGIMRRSSSLLYVVQADGAGIHILLIIIDHYFINWVL